MTFFLMSLYAQASSHAHTHTHKHTHTQTTTTKTKTCSSDNLRTEREEKKGLQNIKKPFSTISTNACTAKKLQGKNKNTSNQFAHVTMNFTKTLCSCKQHTEKKTITTSHEL